MRNAATRKAAMLGAVFFLLSGSAQAAATPRLSEFEAALSTQDSATAALGGWCAAHHLAQPAVMTASAVKDADAPVPGDLHKLLAVGDTETISYRHVQLSCGGVVLSEAHNWYVPSRITPEMFIMLLLTDMPFGKVTAPLHFTRQRLQSVPGRSESCPERTILSHRALLHLPDGLPLALVVECYTAANLGGTTPASDPQAVRP